MKKQKTKNKYASGIFISFIGTYFIGIAILQYLGVINASFFHNVILGLLAPIYILIKPKRLRILYITLIIIAGLSLLYKESYLPSYSIIWNFLADPATRPTFQFVSNFALHLIGFRNVAGLAIFVTIAITSAHLKYGKIFLIVCAILSIFSLLVTSKVVQESSMDINDFYAQEVDKKVSFPDQAKEPYNIIILQICSLSWDDLSFIKNPLNRFLSQFDVLFTNFNSATGYSDPAALRLLRGTCGQVSEGDIFTKQPEEGCAIMDVLQQKGYKTFTVLNHDGKYSGFLEQIATQGHAATPPAVDVSKFQPSLQFFDGSPIYDDYQMLSSWYKMNLPQPSALYYNSITLHSGVYDYGGEQLASDAEQYSQNVDVLTADLEKFFSEIKESGENTIVILIGEHGAALRGSEIQKSTVREIPLPSITIVPALVKIFGPGFNEQDKGLGLIIDKQVSYFGLYSLIADIMDKSPVKTSEGHLSSLLDKVPETPFVAENENALVQMLGDRYIYKNKKVEGDWLYLRPDVTPVFDFLSLKEDMNLSASQVVF